MTESGGDHLYFVRLGLSLHTRFRQEALKHNQAGLTLGGRGKGGGSDLIYQLLQTYPVRY